MQMYCITIKDDHLGKISKLGYLPVGLGKDIFSKSFIRDNSGENITEKIHIMENIHFITGFGEIN